jgi:MinD superfamily P-loop ATPase
VRELVVLSGKGGTGKTSLTASFAALAEGAVVVDCDVSAPNLALVLDPVVEVQERFVAGDVAEIDPAACQACGECARVCRFDAVTSLEEAGVPAVDPLRCEGCGVCAVVCPERAIHMVPAERGAWFVSRTRFGPLVHARLAIGGENSGKLVAQIRRTAKDVAFREGCRLLISDGPPGVGCPVIASVSGVGLALIVAEPSVAAVHDVERLAELLRHFRVAALLCVNRYDLDPELTRQLETRAAALDIEPVGRIPIDAMVVRAQLARKCVVECTANGAGAAIRRIWDAVESAMRTDARTGSVGSPAGSSERSGGPESKLE